MDLWVDPSCRRKRQRKIRSGRGVSIACNSYCESVLFSRINDMTLITFNFQFIINITTFKLSVSNLVLFCERFV